MKNQICTILGGGGFIGRYLVRNLTKKNYRCIITTRKPFQKGYLKTQATPGAIELLDWNPNNFSDLKEAIKNSDIVVNLKYPFSIELPPQLQCVCSSVLDFTKLLFCFSRFLIKIYLFKSLFIFLFIIVCIIAKLIFDKEFIG